MTSTLPPTELVGLDATAQAELVRRRRVSAAELVSAAIERIERLDPVLNAVVTRDFEQALQTARGQLDGPLAGVPYLVKDLGLECAGLRLTNGSAFLRDTVPDADSELAVRLRGAGLVILGRTSTPEFGLLPACEPARFGPTRNPWDTSRSTSGSSGGSAAAVAAGMVPMAHGNDLGGSIRFPASACGLFGLKPSRGRNPAGLLGDVTRGWAVDHALTRSVRDSAALLDATGGAAAGEPFWAPPQRRPFAVEVGADPGRLRIAFTPRTPDGTRGHPDCVAALDDAVALCESLGHRLVEADLGALTPAVGAAIGTVYRAWTAWMTAHWARRLGRRPAAGDLEPSTRLLLEAGRGVGAAAYLEAVETLQAFAREVADFLRSFDAWLTPTMSEPPAPLGAITSTPDQPGRAAERGGRTVAYPAVVANITGNPAMSVPLWWSPAGLPVGVHFLGRFGDEATLFRLAGQMETARPWAHRTPAVAAVPAVPPAAAAAVS